MAEILDADMVRRDQRRPEEFPKFRVRRDERYQYVTMREAAARLNSFIEGWTVVGEVLLEDFTVRPATEAELEELERAADRYAESK
jgi:hypothetical protein